MLRDAYQCRCFYRNTEYSDLSALLPGEKTPAAAIKHSLDVVKDVVDFLNPGQIPLFEFDQQLFAIAKKIGRHHHNNCCLEN